MPGTTSRGENEPARHSSAGGINRLALNRSAVGCDGDGLKKEAAQTARNGINDPSLCVAPSDPWPR
jgi:hypothetical protein